MRITRLPVVEIAVTLRRVLGTMFSLLPQRLLLPAVPGAALFAWILLAQRAFLGRDVVDRPAEPERDRLQARVHLGVDGADRRALHVRPDHDIAVPAHQRDRLVTERRGER